MRILTAVVERATLPVFHAGQYLALRGAVALELVCNDDPWHICQALEELPEELLRGPLVTPTLHQDIEDIVVLIHRAPEVVPFAINCQKDLIQMPLVARSRPSATELIRVGLPKLPAPLPDSFMGHCDAAFEQQFFHIAVAEGEPIIKPDPVTDDFAGKAVVLVTRGVCGWGHVWLPILEFAWSGRSHHQGNYVMGQEAGSTS
jgi:hypothetical protein